MKVILNKDHSPLGDEGDVKDVAKGYARNFLFPRGIALPYNEITIKIFESRREEIEARKAGKRTDAAGLKERLESLNVEITMPAGPNGKLYGAVTSQSVMDELNKLGFQIERKKIELPGSSIKNTGKFKVTVKLYENASAELNITVLGQEIKSETRTPSLGRFGKSGMQGRKQRDSRDTPANSGDNANKGEAGNSGAAPVPDAEAAGTPEQE